MAEQAYVYIKNKLTAAGSIHVFHKLPDGSEASNCLIDNASQERIILIGTEEWIEINAPEGMDSTKCWAAVKSDADASISYSWESPNWTIRIVPNTASPNTPTTMNVTVGDDEPE